MIEAAEQAAAEATVWCEHCGFRPATTAVHRGLCQDCRASYRHGLALWLHDLLWHPWGAADNQRPQPRSYWGRLCPFSIRGCSVERGAWLLLDCAERSACRGAVDDLALMIVWAIVLSFGAGIGGLVGVFVVPESNDERRQRTEGRAVSFGPSQPGGPHATLCRTTLLFPRGNAPVPSMTRPGLSACTLERTSKQPPHDSSRAAERSLLPMCVSTERAREEAVLQPPIHND